MVVLAARRVLCLDAHRPRHPEMKDEGASVIEVRDGIARPPAASCERAALKPGGAERTERRTQLRREDLDLRDLPLLHRAIKRTRHGFGFRQFRHLRHAPSLASKRA